MQRKGMDGQIEGQTEDQKGEILSKLNHNLLFKNLNSLISNMLFRSEILKQSMHGQEVEAWFKH